MNLGSSPLARGKREQIPGPELREGLIPARAGKTDRECSVSLRVTAHPRSRGENSFVGSGLDRGGGSSPLARGKRRGPCFLSPSEGLIPARAGKTFSPCRARTCGPGSSPLARGKLQGIEAHDRRRGLIPARAGKTFAPGSVSHIDSAHPRSRGENDRQKIVLSVVAGSSPLARGKHRRIRPSARHRGLIPARAGKTVVLKQIHTSLAAHPRSRGENLLDIVQNFL